MRTRDLFPLLLSCLAAACAGNKTAAKQSDDTTPDNSAIVIHGTEFTGSVLDGLRNRVPSARVSTSESACPRIIFRGQRSVLFQANPSVYVDGTLLSDTCVLTQISALDVDYVEIYPSGITSRPAIYRNPFGLILIFRRKE